MSPTGADADVLRVESGVTVAANHLQGAARKRKADENDIFDGEYA